MNWGAFLSLIGQLSPIVKEHGPAVIAALMAIWNKPGMTDEEFLAHLKVARKSYEDQVPDTQLPKP